MQEAGQNEKISHEDVGTLLLRNLFFGVKDTNDCGTLMRSVIKKLTKVYKGEQDKVSDKERKEVSDAMEADLVCIDKTMAGMQKLMTDLKDNKPKSLEELESRLGHLALGYGKLQRTMPGLFTGVAVLKHLFHMEIALKGPKPSGAPPMPTKPSSKRELSEQDLAKLLDMMFKQ